MAITEDERLTNNTLLKMILDALQGTYDSRASSGVGGDEIYCPETRRPCMGRNCAAALREGLAEGEHSVEWSCTAHPCAGVIDYDEA